MLRGSGYNVEDPGYKIERDIFVKEIAHGVDENGAGLFPIERYLQSMRVQGELEAVGIVGAAHRLEAAREAFGVAVFAAGTDLRAAGDGVPSGLSPFNLRVLGHATSREKS